MKISNFRQQKVNADHFSMVPDAQIPRSRFEVNVSHKTTFDSGYLVPIYLDEVLPGDHFDVDMTAFARLTTPLFPIMDNLYLESFFFFVPNRLVWQHWVNMMGQQANPADSISYTIPQITSPVGGWLANSLEDYFGLPTAGQVTAGQTVTHSSLYHRAYNLIWNEWFRDENLQNSLVIETDDGPDTPANYSLQRRGKRKDYFTGCLPWPQKGATPVTLPLGTRAPVRGLSVTLSANNAFASAGIDSGGTSVPSGTFGWVAGTAYQIADAVNASGTAGTGGHQPNVYADLSSATAATINSIRTAFQIQRLLERDARGGTRYTELVRSHFGVQSPDARLQRPEYLGGGSARVNFNPLAQLSGTGASGQTTPLGQLGATATALAQRHHFNAAFVEHGMVIGLVCVRAEQTYQQGLHKRFRRLSRYDFYFPVFAHLGEQVVLNEEIYATGVAATDQAGFGYQERWAELRFKPSLITGQFRSTYSAPLDAWHLANKFTSLPTLNTTFVQENPPIARILATAAIGAQFYFDSFFTVKMTRPLPIYSVPGLVDHF
nr:MAG: major capsid protein [Microviridae sp.]